ncbi:glycoside hydrolase domain-containing protein [Nocardioides sp. C4-1]|uniref:glycoside hydrolase domain-containing protein n=1 Tax=Nocardioides sp. C4-1 TaxID=3151851 RepID=UPI003267094A
MTRTALVGAAALALVATTTSAGTSPVTATTSAAPTTSAPATALTAQQTAARKASALPPTPGDFVGYGFDQCLAPTQKAMDTWLNHSPFLAVGIYISGNSRACRSQPNLTPAWVLNQLTKGWKLLPITLGPQASCQPRFPRYSDDPKIIPTRGAKALYPQAREQGRASGAQSVVDARRLGIPEGSTLWYDLEGFDHTNRDCRESALAFLTTWNLTVEQAGFATGVYSSAGSGIKAMDDVRRTRPTAYTLPENIWLARWDGVANTRTSYIGDAGWNPNRRIKQYRGGHVETHGGVSINIDSNWLEQGRGAIAPAERICGTTKLDFATYGPLRPKTATYTPPADRVRALKCLLKQQGLYTGPVDHNYGPAVVKAVRAWKTARQQSVGDWWYRKNWISLLSFGSRPIVKVGSSGVYGTWVRRVQRALNAADLGVKVAVDGTFDGSVTTAVKRYQARIGRPQTGVVDGWTWAALQAGRR